MLKFRYLIILVLALLPSLSCLGRKTESPDTISARRAFMEMPSGVLDMLSKDARFNMLAYYDNDSIFCASNNLKGVSSLEKVTDSFLSVKITEASTLQIKILKLKNGSDIIMSIYTTGRDGDAMDSDIRFFNTRFEELPKEKYFPEPKISLFFNTKGYTTNIREIERMLPFYSLYYQANPDNSKVSATLMIGDTLTLEDRKLVEMFLQPDVIFEWNGAKFKEIKI